ncbi:MAG: DMT family transporter [Erysipelotrichaceae bacterium]|nr:DMT family transporter [Erysipelotrichaceae bacterium]
MKNAASYCVLFSAICFSFGGLFYKVAEWNSLAICSARSIIAFVVILVFLLIRKHKFVFNKNVVFAALANSLTAILYSISNKMTTAGNVIVLQFTMPIFVILITTIAYKNKPSKLELRTCFLVLFGIVLFFIDSISAGNMLGNSLALISGVTYALYFIFNKKQDSDPFTAILLSLVISSLVGLPELLNTDIVNSSTNTLLSVVGAWITSTICWTSSISVWLN